MNSTPAPAPSPAPSPAPTPSPTPPPTANDDLIAPLVSESFANNASRGAANFSSSGTTTGTAAQASATIRYDAAANSYTLTTGGGSITFGPADIDSGLSTATAAVYKRSSGANTTDTLTLTKAGTSGAVTYQYVGSAFWQHTVLGATSGSGWIDAIVYGVPTPSGARPTTGTASYPIDMIGAETAAGGVNPLSGTGVAAVDFALGTVSISGSFTKTQERGQTGIFSSSATIAAGTNGFSGSFGFEDFGTFQGTMAGQFFGPAAAEIGASFATSAADGRVAVGTVMGRQGTLTSNASFPADGNPFSRPPYSQLFSTREAKLTFTSTTGAQNNDTANAFSAQAAASDGLSIFYNTVTQTYTLTAADRGRTFDNGLRATPMVGTETETFSPATALALTYVRSARWLRRAGASYRVADFIYGMPSTAAQVPRTGKGGYALLFSGYAADSGYLNAMLVTGSGALKVDFGTGALNLTGTLNFGEDYVMSGRRPAAANTAVSGAGTLSSSANSFSGSLSFGGIGNYAGQFEGQFFGPAATEVGAQFTASDGGDRVVGTFTGKQDASILAAQQTLAGLTTKTDLTAYSAHVVYIADTKLSYDPATGNYVFGADDRTKYGTIDHTFGPADIVTTRSDASKTYYQHSDAIGDVSGYVFKPGSGNPVLALTYSGFADLTFVNRPDTAAYEEYDRYFLVFGLQTPSSVLPRSGSATYSGIARGLARGGLLGNNWVPVSGTSGLSADFGSALLTLTLNLTADNPVGSPVGSYVYNGQIANNGFYGNGNGAGFRGGFFGPNAEEFAAVWQLLDDRPQVRIESKGIAIGKQN